MADKINMVKVTIKRAEDSTEDNKWVCKRMDDDLESATAVETIHGANETLAAEHDNLNMCNADDWCHTIPSYLEVEMKEGENLEPSRRNSTENNAKISMTHCLASNHETIDSAGTSCNDPMDLSTSHSTVEFQRDTKNVSYKSPPEVHTPKRKFMGNAHTEGRNAPSLTEADKIIQGEPPYYPFRTWWPTPIHSQMNSGDTFVMPTVGMPPTCYNFPMNHQSVFPFISGLGNTEVPETTMQSNIPHQLTQDAQSHLKTNYKHFSTDMSHYGYRSNANAIPLKNVFAERKGDSFVNNLSQNHPNNLERPAGNCAQIGSSDASKSVCPPRKKQSHAEVPDKAYNCHVCRKTFKSSYHYRNHLSTKQHLKKEKDYQQQSNVHNFQPNSQGSPLGPLSLQAQLPLPPHVVQLWNNQMMYHHFQTGALFSTYESEASGSQKSAPETSKNDCNKESLGYIRPQNYLGAECYPQNPRHVSLPVSHTNNPQGNFLPPNPQSENSKLANPRYLVNKASQSSQAPKDISIETHPKGFTAASSFRKSEDVPSMIHNQEDLFQIYHCLVCSIFKTNFLQEMELHINADRSRTPLELINHTNGILVCTLCGFKSQDSREMAQHCTSETHVNRVRYYNHVREGGIHRTKNIFTDIPPAGAVWVFCDACEYAINEMMVLKAHASNPNHQYNVSCCMYIESFRRAVEYCFCRLCYVTTPTKRELRKHALSKEHKKALEKYSPDDSNFRDPRHIFYIKELSLNKEEPPRVSEQKGGNTLMGREEPHLRVEKKEDRNVAENLASTNLNSASSTSLQPLPVSCSLCQQVFPEINGLAQHLQRLHGVNESGVKWLVSTISKESLKMQKEKSLPEKELPDIKTRKMKSVTVWPEESSAGTEKSPVKRMSIDSSSRKRSFDSSSRRSCVDSSSRKSSVDSSSRKSSVDSSSRKSSVDSSSRKSSVDSSSHKSSVDSSSYKNFVNSSSFRSPVVTGLNIENEYSRSPRAVRSGQNVATDKNMNQERKASSSSEVFGVTKCMRNVDKLDETFRLNPYEISCTDLSSSQKFCETESMRNPDLHHERRINTDSTSRQQFCETKNLLPVEVKNAPKSEERLDSNPYGERMVEYDSKLDEDNKNVKEMDDSSSDEFSSTETGSLSYSVFNTSIESNESSSNDDYERLSAKSKPISSAGSSMVTESSPKQLEALDSQYRRSPVEYQPNLNLRRNADNCSPANNLMTSVEPKQKANNSNSILIKIDNSNDSVNDRMELNDHPLNLSSTTDSQIQATKSIENIEISSVFSLRGHIDISINTDDDEETSDVDLYSDI